MRFFTEKKIITFLFFLCIFFSLKAQQQNIYKIRSIQVTGNDKTKESVILREISIKKDSSYHSSQFDSLAVRNTSLLFNLQLFNKVNIFFIPADSSNLDLKIEVKERWFFFPVPILELGDRTFTEFTRNFSLNRINYGVRLVENNLFGVRQQIRTTLQAGFTRKFSLDYIIPYINKKKTFGTVFNFTYKTNFEVWYSTENNQLKRYKESSDDVSRRMFGKAGLFFRPAFFDKYEIGIYGEQYSIKDTLGSVIARDYFGNGRSSVRYLLPYFLFVHDTRDRKYYAENGKFISLELNYTITDNPAIKFPSAYFKWSTYKKLDEKFNFAQNTVFKLTGNNYIPYFFYNALGYDYKMRGYEIYVVDGRNFIMAQQHIAWKFLKQREYNFNMIKINRKFSSIPIASYLRVFGDVGYVQDNQFAANNSFRNKIISSCGVGIDLVTYYDNVFRFDVSYLSNNFFREGFVGAYVSFYNNF